jgi:predicted PurR-regulated permease PerM
MDGKTIQTGFFFLVFVLLFVGVIRIFTPFFTVFLWATLLYILVSPVYSAVLKLIPPKGRLGGLVRSILAAVFAIITVVLIISLIVWIGIQLYHQMYGLIKNMRTYLAEHPDFLSREFNQLSSFVKDISLGQIDLEKLNLKSQVLNLLGNSSQRLLQYSTSLVKHLGAFLAGLAFLVFTLFFFFIDGAYLFNLLVRVIPIKKDYVMQLAEKFKEITQNLFMGYILVALVQATIAFILFSLFGVQGSLVFSIILFFCTFIPIIGAGAIWGPIGIFKIVTGDVVGGILFLLLSGFFISTLDNILRPLFLKDRINLHPLIIFFAILGGVSVFGLNGLVLGPMIVILFLTVLDLFFVEHGINPERDETHTTGVSK